MGLKYFLYFLFGGIITSAVTYLANNARGLFAAFISKKNEAFILPP